MNTHSIFKSLIIPELLLVAEEEDVLKNITSISLYGSANYVNYDKGMQVEKFSEESDYDIWIVFERDCLDEGQTFATKLFRRAFKLPSDCSSACILYDKIVLQTSMGSFLLAPMIVMEEAYNLLEASLLTVDSSLSISWYRSRSRERPPKVPICFTDLSWSEFNMHQRYISETDIWKSDMPIVVRQKELMAMGTFLECALSGDCLYGNYQLDNQLRKTLFLRGVQHLNLEEMFEKNEVAIRMYEMMTLNGKAGQNFKKTKVEQFSQWFLM